MCHVEDRKEISVLHPLYAVDLALSSIWHVAGNVICHAGRKCEVDMKCHVHVLLVSCKRKCHFWSSVACGTFCTFLTLSFLGIHLITIIHKKSRRYSELTYPHTLHVYCNFCLIHVNSYSQSAVTRSTDYNSIPIPSCSWWHSVPHRIVIAPVHRSGSLSIEYNTIWVYLLLLLSFCGSKMKWDSIMIL